MKKYIIICFILIFSTFVTTYSKTFYGEISNFFTTESLIIGITNKVEFKFEITLKSEDTIVPEFFLPDIQTQSNFINFIDMEILPINSIKSGNKLLFKNSKTGDSLNEINFILKGTAIFNWFTPTQNRNLIRIGYLNSRKNPVFLNLNLIDFNPIHSLKIKINEHMDLGVNSAGEKLSTINGGNAHPADISISGETGKNIVVHIPKNITIINKTKDTLIVNLFFRENRDTQLIKQLLPNGTTIVEDKNRETSLISHILIDGETQTQSKSSGTYKGHFTVRVEYFD